MPTRIEDIPKPENKGKNSPGATKFKFAITYKADDDATILVSHSAGFSVSPKSIPVAAAALSVKTATINVKNTGSPSSRCILHFDLGGRTTKWVTP